jgi:hypothetical protein
MLTTDHANRIDAINTAASVAALLGELLGNREPDAQLSLSAKSTQGLCEILTFLGDHMEDAAIGLRAARNDLADAVHGAQAASVSSEAAFGLGYAAGLAENDPFVGSGNAHLSGIRIGTLSGYRCGWMDAGGDAKQIKRDWRDKFIAEMMLSCAGDGEEPAQKPAAPAFVGTAPVLTEPVPEDMGGGNVFPGYDEQRQSA